MKLVLDQGLPISTVRKLRELDWLVDHVAEIGMEQASDRQIIKYAGQKETGVIVTLDSDFHALLAVCGHRRPSVIRVRQEGLKGEAIANLLHDVCRDLKDMLVEGAFVTITRDRVRVRRFARTNAGALPLGYKQRLAMACAVLHSPAILFVDEPTSGVDPLTRREFWGRINTMAAQGVTVLVTSHFLDEAEYCDRLAIMHESRVIALGAPDAIKRDHADDPDAPLETAFVNLIRAQESAGEAAA